MKVLNACPEKYRKKRRWTDRRLDRAASVATLFLMVALLSACSARKHLSDAGGDREWKAGNISERDQYLQLLTAQGADFTAIQARAKGYLTLNNQENHEVTLQLRMKKDEAIWISATAMLGMEAGRLLIRPDSISVINRLESTYMVQPFERIHEWLGYELDFAVLQQLLLGQFRDLGILSGLQFFTSPDGQGRFSRSGAAEVVFDPDQHLTLWQIRNFFGEVLEVRHAYSPPVSDPDFPSKTSISFQTPRLKLISTLDYNRLERLEQVEMPFSIPKGYRQIY